jgi:hypothetical protein
LRIPNEVDSLFKVRTANFLNLKNDTNIQAGRSPVNFNLTKSIPRHLTIKFSKVKDETKESQDCKRKETNNTRGVSICLTADFSEEILQANRVAQGFHSIESLKKKKNTLPTENTVL